MSPAAPNPAEYTELVATRRDLHAHPELGFQESKSSALLQQELRANGFAIQAGVAGMPTYKTLTRWLSTFR
jgi:metal-dependent amidase/aminoacylase/carboxypeptidase family protein